MDFAPYVHRVHQMKPALADKVGERPGETQTDGFPRVVAGLEARQGVESCKAHPYQETALVEVHEVGQVGRLLLEIVPLVCDGKRSL